MSVICGTKSTLSASGYSVMGRKETPFSHLQFTAQSVPPPQIVTAPLYLWTLWCYTNAVIIIIIIMTTDTVGQGAQT